MAKTILVVMEVSEKESNEPFGKRGEFDITKAGQKQLELCTKHFFHYQRNTNLETTLLEQTMYSASSVYGFWKLWQLVRSHTQFPSFARNLYLTDNGWPLSFITEIVMTKKK